MAQKYLKLGNVLKKLLFDNNMKPADLARKVNIPSPTIHRLVTGKSTRPYKSSLQPIADYFAIKLDQLLGEEPLEISINDANQTHLNTHHIPLIPWKFLEQDTQKNALYPPEEIAFSGKMSENCFATILQDSSMEPLFPRDSLLIFDSAKTPKDRSYVLVKLNDNLLVFRQLLIDLDLKYLKPLNPDLNVFKMRLVGKKDKIIGTLVEARQLYNEF